MKELPIRKFTTVVQYLTEAVLITHDGAAIGTYTPIRAIKDVKLMEVSLSQDGPGRVIPVEEPVKKAIEADEVKQTPRGQLRKGLGEIPGDAPEKHYPMGTLPGTLPRDNINTVAGHDIGFPKPAPKPGKK